MYQFIGLLTVAFIIYLFPHNLYGQSVDLVRPDNDFTTIDTLIYLEWDDVESATFYEIEVSVDETFSSSFLYSTASSYYELSPLEYTYNNYMYWRVRSFDGSVYSSWSDTRSFYVIQVSTLPDIKMWISPDSVELEAGKVSKAYNLVNVDYSPIQTNAALQPTIIPNAMNGENALSFENNSFLRLMTFDELLQQPNQIYCAFKQTEFSGPTAFVYDGVNASNLHYIGIWDTTRVRLLGGSGFFNNNHQRNKFQISNALFDGVNSINWLSGVAVTGNGGSMAFDGITIAAAYNGSQRFYGHLFELIVFNEPTTAELNSVINNFFRFKYFPPANLGKNNIEYAFCDIHLTPGDGYVSYLWSDGSNNDTLTVTESGTYWVEVVDVMGNISSDTIMIKIPEIDTPAFAAFCPGESVTWNANLGPHYTYDWSTGETTESIDIDASGTYFVTVTDTNGCSKTFPSIAFEEDAYATTVSLGPDVNLCSGNAISLVSGAAETVSYLWNTSETNPSIEVNSTGTYSVTTTNANGCEANDDIVVTIIGDAPVVQIGMDANYCQAEEFTFTDNSFTTDGSNITSWSWDFGDLGTSAASNGTYAYADHGQVTVNLTISTDAGCDNSGQLVVDVYQKPIIDFSVVNACQLDEIQFNATQSTLTLIGDWTWDFGDPASGAENTAAGENTTHIFDTHGDFTVTLYAEDVLGCRDTTEQLVSILPTPQVDFTFTEVCQGQTVNFVNNSTIASPALIATTQWQLGAGATSTQFSPSRLYTVAGTFDITLTVTANNGCVQAQTQPMKVHALPQPDYTYTASCAGLPTVFTDNSTVPDGEVAFITWQFNANNPVNANPVSHTFTNPGEQQIRQTVISAFGCQFTAISSIVTHPALSAEFSTDPDLLLAGLPITFTNESVGADNVLWEIDAFYSGSDENPALTFDETYIDDTLTIVLIAYNDFGCSDTLVEEMRVYEAITDLAVTNIFTYIDPSGYETIGAELSNLGSSTITRADVFLRLADQLPMKGVYEGELRPGEKEVYVFETTIFPSTNLDTEEDQYICVNAQIVLPAGLVDERPENNERCLARTEDVPVLLTPYPNPASDVVNIKVILPAEEVLDIYVYDATGKVVSRLANKSTLPQGATTYQLAARELAVGTYTVYLVRENGDKKVVRFVVR